MKRFLAILLAATLLLSLAPATSMAATQYATVIGGWLRLRAEPNFSATTITSYYTGTQVKVLGTSGSWYRVETPDNRTGYMYGSYLSFNGGGGGGGEGTAVVTSHNGYGVRLRTGPGTGYRIIKVYPVGTPATVLQRGSYWSKLNIAGTVGYMMNQFLNFGGGGGGGTEVLCYATIWSRNGYGVRLRTGPGKGYAKIGVYSVGTTVAVLEKGAVWDRIQVGSRIGWMMNEFLSYYSSNVVTDVRLNNANPVVGNVLAVQGLTPSQATVSYSWLVGGVQKGTASTYTVDSSDIGKKIQLKVTGTGNYTGSATSPETNVVVSNTEIVGVALNTMLPVVGNTLTATIDPAGAKVIYAWKVGGMQVSNGKTYTVKAADLNKQIELIVTGTGVFTGWASSGLTQPVTQSGTLQSVSVTNQANNTDATVTAPNVGDTLKATYLPSTATVSYAWWLGSIKIGAASTLTITPNYAGKTITLTASGTGSYTGTITKTVKPATQLKTVTLFDIQGVPTPAAGGTPVTSIAPTAEYSGAVSWSPNDATFQAGTAYTATITLSPLTDYTLTGVAQNQFKVAGATATNAANSGSITAVFPATASVTLTGVKAPAAVTGIANGTDINDITLPATVTLVTSGGETNANVTWDRASANPTYNQSATTEQTFAIPGKVTLPGGVSNPSNVSLDVSVSVTVNAAGAPAVTLTSITSPSALTGIDNGTDINSINLPASVDIVTSTGTATADVTWNRAGASPAYNQSATTEQTFTIPGTVTLPVGVTNPSNVSLNVSVSVTVSAANVAPISNDITPDITLTGITNPAPVTGAAVGIVNGMTIEEIIAKLPKTVEITTSTGATATANVVWDPLTVKPAYDSASPDSQAFTMEGAVTLPDGVTNPDNQVPQTATIKVTVDAAQNP